MIAVRKMLDFVFTQEELKILDDVMPDQHKQDKHLEKSGGKDDPADGAGGGGLIPNASSGNVAIPLANGNILKIPVDKFNAGGGTGSDQCSINISEQLAKSSAWKTIDQQAHLSADAAAQNGSVTHTMAFVLNCSARSTLANYDAICVLLL